MPHSVTSRRSSTYQSGKAELGLLAALFLLVGLVAGAVWLVVQNSRTSQNGAIVKKRSTEQRTNAVVSMEHTRKPRSGEWKTTVTIVEDTKAQAAIAEMRTIRPDDGRVARAAETQQSKAVQAPVAQLEVDGQVIGWDSPEVRSAVELLKQYQAAKLWKDKLPLVHQSGQAQPLMEEYYGSQGQSDPEIAGLVSASNLRIGNRSVLALSYSSGDRLNRLVHANFWRSSEGLRLDWESFVGFSGKGMGSFRANHTTEPTVFRVLAVPDDYYNFEFTDSKKYLSLRLYSPGGDDYLHGYCARDSADGKKVLEILGDSAASNSSTASRNGLRSQMNGHFPITVQIAFPENAQSDRCVRIDKFVSPWWLALDVEKQTTAALETGTASDTRAPH